MIRAKDLQIGDDIVIKGVTYTVTYVWASYKGLTQILTDDGIKRKFPDSYTMGRWA